MASEPTLQLDFNVFYAEAIFSYTPQEDGEAGFDEGESLKIVGENEFGWWLAQNQLGQLGWVPSNFFKKLDGVPDEFADNQPPAYDDHQHNGEDEDDVPVVKAADKKAPSDTGKKSTAAADRASRATEEVKPADSEQSYSRRAGKKADEDSKAEATRLKSRDSSKRDLAESAKTNNADPLESSSAKVKADSGRPKNDALEASSAKVKVDSSKSKNDVLEASSAKVKVEQSKPKNDVLESSNARIKVDSSKPKNDALEASSAKVKVDSGKPRNDVLEASSAKVGADTSKARVDPLEASSAKVKTEKRMTEVKEARVDPLEASSAKVKTEKRMTEVREISSSSNSKVDPLDSSNARVRVDTSKPKADALDASSAKVRVDNKAKADPLDSSTAKVKMEPRKTIESSEAARSKVDPLESSSAKVKLDRKGNEPVKTSNQDSRLSRKQDAAEDRASLASKKSTTVSKPITPANEEEDDDQPPPPPKNLDASQALKSTQSASEFKSANANPCAICSKELSGVQLKVDAIGMIHLGCFKCYTCQKSLADGGSENPNVSEGKIFCDEHFANLSSINVCPKCKKELGGAKIKAMDRNWHRECFVCGNCGAAFKANKFHRIQGSSLPICADCYKVKYAPVCDKCKQPIAEGTTIKVMGKSYHTECFVCPIGNHPMATTGPLKQVNGVLCCAEHVNDLIARMET